MIRKFVAIYREDIGPMDTLQNVANCATNGIGFVVHADSEWVIMSNVDIDPDNALTNEDIHVITQCEAEQFYDDEGGYEFTLDSGTKAEVVA